MCAWRAGSKLYYFAYVRYGDYKKCWEKNKKDNDQMIKMNNKILTKREVKERMVMKTITI